MNWVGELMKSNELFENDFKNCFGYEINIIDNDGYPNHMYFLFNKIWEHAHFTKKLKCDYPKDTTIKHLTNDGVYKKYVVSRHDVLQFNREFNMVDSLRCKETILPNTSVYVELQNKEWLVFGFDELDDYSPKKLSFFGYCMNKS